MDRPIFSRELFPAKGAGRVDTGGAGAGNPSGEESCYREDTSGGGAALLEFGGVCGTQAERESEGGPSEGLAEDELADLSGGCAKCHVDPAFLGSPSVEESEDSVDADSRRGQASEGEATELRCLEPRTVRQRGDLRRKRESLNGAGVEWT